MRSAINQTLLITFLILRGPYLSFSQNSDSTNSILSKIDSVVNYGIQEKAFPGAVIYVSWKDSLLIHKSYGYHTYENIRLVQTHHLYDLASVTKVTAGTISLMKLYDQGLIDLDKTVSDYVPGIGNNKRGKASLRETLAHQAGWRPWIPYYQSMIDENGYKKRFFRSDSSENYPIKIKDNLYLTSKNYKYIKKQIKRSDFDEKRGFAYSGLFFYLIPELVENLSGSSFQKFLKDSIYSIVGSQTTGFNPLERFPDSLIVPTELDTFFRNYQIHGTVHDEGAILMGGISGNAGLFSNAEDLARIWKIFLNEGKHDTMQVLSPQVVDLFTTAQYPNNKNRRGLGFDKPLLKYDSTKSSVAKAASYRSFGHSGYTGPLIWADPENDLLFIFLANRVYPSRNQRQIYDLNIRPMLHQLCYDLVASKDLK